MPPGSLRRPADWLPRAIVAGFSATMVLLAVHLVGYAVLRLFDALAPTGTLSHRTMTSWLHALVYNRLTDPGQPWLYVAISLQIVLGLAGGLIYAAIFERRMREAEWLRGLIFGLGTWVGTLVVLLPLLGAGPFGTALGAGSVPIYTTLLAHVGYGITLGLVYPSTGDIAVADGTAERPAPAGWRRSALGAAIGTLVGAAVGLAVGVLVPWQGAVVPADVMPMALMLGAALAGGGIGELVGSLSALPTHTSSPRHT